MTGVWLALLCSGDPPDELPVTLMELEPGYCAALPHDATVACEAPAVPVVDRCEFYGEEACRRSGASLACRTPEGDPHGETWTYGASPPLLRTYQLGVRQGPSREDGLTELVDRDMNPRCGAEPSRPLGCNLVRATFHEGLLDGPWSCTHEASEQTFIAGSHHSGLRVGVWSWWGRDGRLLGQTTYATTGSQTERTWCADGSVALEGALEDGLRSGRFRERECGPRPDRRCDQIRAKYRRGVRHGQWICERDGAVTIEGRYKDGLPDGRWVFRGERGRVVGTTLMRRGRGTFIEHCPNGHKHERPLRNNLSPCYERDPE